MLWRVEVEMGSSCGDDGGSGMRACEVASRFLVHADAVAVEHAMDTLYSVGLVYSTTDDQTFRVLDAPGGGGASSQ